MNEVTSRMVRYEIIPRERTTIAASQIDKGFAFAPMYRSRIRLGDANTFQSRARMFCQYYGLHQPMFFNNDGDNDAEHFADNQGLAARRAAIITALDESPKPIDVVAYFGHGFRRGLSSAGFFGETGVQEFANVLARNANRRLVVILNACSSGAPGGFANQLCGALLVRGIHATVFAHQVSGHATNNPTKRRYPGGEYLVEPGSRYYLAWRRKLWESDLWLRYPFMESDELMHAIRS